MADKELKKIKKPFDFQRFWSIWNLVEAVVILTAGVLAVIFGIQYLGKDPGEAGGWIQNVLPFMVGAFIAMDAILRIVTSLNRKDKQTDESILLIAGFELTASIVIMIMYDQFIRLMIYAVGVLLLVIGALLVLFSVMTIIRHSKKLFVPILEIVFSAVLIAVGIAILILYSMKTDNNGIVLLVAGIVFCIAALAQGILSIVNLVKAKKNAPIDELPAKEENQQPVDDSKSKQEAIPEENKPLLEQKKDEDHQPIDVEVVERKD